MHKNASLLCEYMTITTVITDASIMGGQGGGNYFNL